MRPAPARPVQSRLEMALQLLIRPRGANLMTIRFRRLPPPPDALRHNNSARVAFVAIALLLITGPLAAAPPSPFSTFLVANATVQGIGHDAAGNVLVLGTVTNSPIPDRKSTRLNSSHLGIS